VSWPDPAFDAASVATQADLPLTHPVLQRVVSLPTFSSLEMPP
jgi:hypothetical protein